MKKIFLLGLILLSFNGFSQMATSANQQIEINILRQLQASGVTVTVSVASSTVQMTSSASSVTSSGTVTTGAYGVLFETSGDFSGTIDGLRFLGNGFLSYPVSGGNKYPAIPYTVSAGTLYIRKLN